MLLYCPERNKLGTPENKALGEKDGGTLKQTLLVKFTHLLIISSQ